jgi:predicted peptidase
MTKKSPMPFLYPTALKAGICLLFALFTPTFFNPAAAQATGYQLITAAVDQDLAAKKKNEILQISNDLFDAGTYTGSNKESIGYRLLKPAANAGIRKYPLILIFHNSGKIGTDNTAQLDVLVKYWAQPEVRTRYPAYVVAVQFPVRSSNYTNLRDLLTSNPAPCLLTALQLADSLKKVLPVDHNRIYSLGFSMGASTANNAMMARPDLFAAGICISGIPMQENAERLKNIPLWLIHGNKDNDNPIPGDRAFYKKINGYKHAKIMFWEIEGLEHKIYAPLYTTRIMPEWLFALQKKNR